jgi:hypothetical protein
MLRLTPKIDHTMCDFFTRLQTLPADERFAIMEAIKCGVRHDTVAEIPAALLSVDAVLAALWGQWQDALSMEAWAAVLKTVFLKGVKTSEDLTTPLSK